MNVSVSKRRFIVTSLSAGALCLAAAVTLTAQVTTETTTTTGQATHQVDIDRGEVVTVEGNDLVVKLEDGTLRHIANVPESAKVDVNGQQLGIHDLKPGMKLHRTITTTSTPRTITTVQKVTGKVWHVTPPTSVILTLEDNTNQAFTVPKGQKFNIDGQMVDVFHLKKGMKVSATKIVEVPETVVTQHKSLTGSMPPAPPADEPLLVAAKEPTPAPTTEEAPAKLPKTATQLPLLAFIGLALVGTSLGMRLLRRA